jgi:hypothetical protein
MQLLRLGLSVEGKDAADVEARMEKDHGSSSTSEKSARANGEMKREIPIRSRMKSSRKAGDRNDRRGPPRPPPLRMLEVDRPLRKPFEPPFSRWCGRGLMMTRAPRDAGEIVRTVGLVQLEIQIIRVVRPARRDTAWAPRDDASKRGLERRWEPAGDREAPGRGGRETAQSSDRDAQSSSKRSRDNSQPRPKADATKPQPAANAYAPNQ